MGTQKNAPVWLPRLDRDSVHLTGREVVPYPVGVLAFMLYLVVGIVLSGVFLETALWLPEMLTDPAV